MKAVKIFVSLIVAFLFSNDIYASLPIHFEYYSSNYYPEITIIDDCIYINHPTGIYSCKISELNEKNDYWDIFAFPGETVNKFKINDKGEILALTDNVYPAGDVLVKRYADGTVKEYSPDIMFEDEVLKSRCYKETRELIQNPVDCNEVILFGFSCIYLSKDFGETWKSLGTYSQDLYSAAYNLHNPDMIILGLDSMFDVVENGFFMVMSISNPDNRNNLFVFDNIMDATDIECHPTNPDYIILAGNNIKRSRDKGNTWEDAGTKFDYDQGISKLIFDKRGSDRLYGILKLPFDRDECYNVYYSDDLGSTWKLLEEKVFSYEGPIAAFEQYGSKLYFLSTEFYLSELDLELVEAALNDAEVSDMIVSVDDNRLIFNNNEEITQIDIVKTNGMKLLSTSIAGASGSIDISQLETGGYIAVFQTESGGKIRKKFIKASSIN